MTREELEAHCKKEIEMCEFWARVKGEDLNNSKIYQEHKLVLELLEQEPCEDDVGIEEELDFVQPKKTVGKLISIGVFDKIRAEVTALKSHHINDSYDNGFQGCRIEVLDILDKYKTESEE